MQHCGKSLAGEPLSLAAALGLLFPAALQGRIGHHLGRTQRAGRLGRGSGRSWKRTALPANANSLRAPTHALRAAYINSTCLLLQRRVRAEVRMPCLTMPFAFRAAAGDVPARRAFFGAFSCLNDTWPLARLGATRRLRTACYPLRSLSSTICLL